MKNYILPGIAALAVCVFVFLLLSPWWAVRQLLAGFDYTTDSPIKISLATDHRGDLFNKNKLQFFSFELPPAEKKRRAVFKIPSPRRRVNGFSLEVSTGRLEIKNLTAAGSGKRLLLNPSECLAAKNQNVTVDRDRLIISGSRTELISFAFPQALRIRRQIQMYPFLITLFIALAAGIIFFRKTRKSISMEKTGTILFVSIGIGIMLFPVMGIDILSKVSSENRFLTEMPPLTVNGKVNTDFPRKFEAFFADRFCGRENMIDLNNQLGSISLLNTNSAMSTGRSAFFGKDGWMFSRKYNAVNMIQNKDRFSPEELRLCTDNLNALADQFKERFNASVYVVLFPDKERVYEEFYPGFLLKQRKHPESRLEQLAKYLQKHSKVTVIYPLPELLKQKKAHRLYYKTGTHPTARGAYYAVREIQKQLRKDFPQFAAVKENILYWKDQKSADLDIALLMGLAEKQIPDEKLIHPEPSFRIRMQKKTVKEIPLLQLYISRYSIKTGSQKPAGLRILAITDSFWSKMRDFMNPVTSELLHVFYGDGRDFLFTPFAAELDQLQPQLVIIESTERFLHRFLTIKWEN